MLYLLLYLNNLDMEYNGDRFFEYGFLDFAAKIFEDEKNTDENVVVWFFYF